MSNTEALLPVPFASIQNVAQKPPSFMHVFDTFAQSSLKNRRFDTNSEQMGSFS
jgi:hypothetical protein